MSVGSTTATISTSAAAWSPSHGRAWIVYPTRAPKKARRKAIGAAMIRQMTPSRAITMMAIPARAPATPATATHAQSGCGRENPNTSTETMPSANGCRRTG